MAVSHITYKDSRGYIMHFISDLNNGAWADEAASSRKKASGCPAASLVLSPESRESLLNDDGAGALSALQVAAVHQLYRDGHELRLRVQQVRQKVERKLPYDREQASLSFIT